MPTEYPTVIPMISYENGIAALEWLAKAFGFRERARQIGLDGRLSHGLPPSHRVTLTAPAQALDETVSRGSPQDLV
jgi:uncharacterized glyoxalase superfamily protein PhnB